MNKSPNFVRRAPDSLGADYALWLNQLRQRYRQSQLKAAVRVNREMLRFYWHLGRDILAMQAEAKWGSGFFEQLSIDLRHTFPSATGLSVPNLRFAKRWYAFYSPLLENQSQPVTDFDMPELFASLPWGHHREIISKVKDIDTALFYVRQAVEGGWGRNTLVAHIGEDLHKHTGGAVTNFGQTLPSLQSDMAQEVLKDPYHFDFLQLGNDYDERELEDNLVRHITEFLLELGVGFAFVGRQLQLLMPNGKAYYPDLVFYHTRMKCYVVVELKVVDFMPEFLGKRNFYVSAADELLRASDDNPSIGLLICKSKDKTTVEWSFRGLTTPMGVAEYQIREFVDHALGDFTKENDDHA